MPDGSETSIRRGPAKRTGGVDAVEPATFAAIRGQDALGRILANIRRVVAVRDSLPRRHRPRLGLTMVLMQQNIDQLPAMVDLAAELGLDSVGAVHLTVFAEELDRESLRHSPDRSDAAFARARERARLRRAPPPSPACVTRLASRRAGTDATPRLDLQGYPSRASNRRTHVVSVSAPIALQTWVVSSVRAVELHQSMTTCSSLTTTAFEPPSAMHREPVGRACGKGDGRRVQDDGLARPRAETAMEKRLGLRYSATFVFCT